MARTGTKAGRGITLHVYEVRADGTEVEVVPETHISTLTAANEPMTTTDPPCRCPRHSS
jgi:polyribonucleotide nucleotidyltransferase